MKCIFITLACRYSFRQKSHDNSLSKVKSNLFINLLLYYQLIFTKQIILFVILRGSDVIKSNISSGGCYDQFPTVWHVNSVCNPHVDAPSSGPLCLSLVMVSKGEVFIQMKIGVPDANSTLFTQSNVSQRVVNGNNL